MIDLSPQPGMGGDRLVADVVGDAAEDAVGDAVRELHDQHFRTGLRTICSLDGAAELVEALAEQGRTIVLASSSEADFVDELLDLVDVRHHLAAVVTASDDLPSKPAPDLVQAAVARVGGRDAVVNGAAVCGTRSPPRRRASPALACEAAA